MMIALEETKRIAGAYKGTTRKFVREDENGDIVLLSDAEDEVIDEIDDDHQHHGENFDIAELVTDNQVLINRLDNILGEDEYGLSTRRSMDQSSEIESLTDSLIDGLFKQVKKNEAKNGGDKTQKKNTNYVSSKKQVVTYEKQQKKPAAKAQAKKPNAKSRLFDYESSHQQRTFGRNASISKSKSVRFADQSVAEGIDLEGSLSSTHAQHRQMKAMEDIKKKGQSRLQNFNKKLDYVREADAKAQRTQ